MRMTLLTDMRLLLRWSDLGGREASKHGGVRVAGDPACSMTRRPSATAFARNLSDAVVFCVRSASSAVLVDRIGPESQARPPATMSLALTIALCLRDDESRLADMIKAAVEVAETLLREHAADEWRDATREEALIEADPSPRPAPTGGLDYELLALDESSRDNTPSVLSILHAKLPQLRSIQDLAPGTAVMRAARSALGRAWLIVDAPFDPQHALWATRQVFCGDPAALVPGEVLAVRRNLGQAALGWHAGGLVGAQREVERLLAGHGQQPAWSPPRERALGSSAKLFARGQLGRLGLGRFDRG